MPVTRTLVNTGNPLIAPDGSLYSYKPVTFQLVKADTQRPISLPDSVNGEYVVGELITVTTDGAGLFSQELWPNTRGGVATYYLVSMPESTAKPFLIRVTEAEGSMLLIDAIAGVLPVPPQQTLTLFEALLATIENHLATATQVVTDTVNGLMSYVDKIRLDTLWPLSSDVVVVRTTDGLAAAVTAAGSTRTTIKFTVDQTLSANLSVPSNITLVPLNGAKIIHGGYTFDYAGSTAKWPDAQVVEGANVVGGLRGRIKASWFGVTGDKSDESTVMQRLFNAVAAASGSVTVDFSQGAKTGAGNLYYNLGSTTISIAKAEIKITGPKYFQFRKTGAGAFFDVVSNGYGFEIENAWFVGDNTLGQVGIKFTGTDIGAYNQGPLNGSVHDCWFEGVGSKTEASETAGGGILVESQCLGLEVRNNIFSQGGYSLRQDGTANGGSDGLKFHHNVCNISRSIAVQMVATQGAASVEIGNNNFANVGGAYYGRLAGYANIYGNEFIPGEAGALGDCVKRDYTGNSLAEDVGGVSAAFIFKGCQFFTCTGNTVVQTAGAVIADYGVYCDDAQAASIVQNNYFSQPGVKGIRVSPLHMFYINNRTNTAAAADLYSNAVHPGIQHFGWDGVTTNYWAFGTQNPSAPFEIASTNISPASGASQFKISNSADPGEWFGAGFDAVDSCGYIQAYGSNAYQIMRHRSPSLFLGVGDTAVVLQGGTSQSSALLRLIDNAGTAAGLPVYADNAAAAALPVGSLYRTAAGVVMIRY